MDTSMLPALHDLLLALESTLLLVGVPLIVLLVRDARERSATVRIEVRRRERTASHDRRA